MKNFITYTNWAYLDDCNKKNNLKPCTDLQYDDLYDAGSFDNPNPNAKIMPVITLFRTNDRKQAAKLEYNFKDRAYDYFFFGAAVSGYPYDAIIKYLRAQKYYGEFAVYINTVSSDNLLFNGQVTVLDKI